MLDLLIKDGFVVDGTGLDRYRADVGVADGRIISIGKIKDSAIRTIDAEGLVICPGFVDGHTHMDAQIFWDKLGASSCYHGVTTAVMGNCGFTLAPCSEADADFVFRNLERAEDLSRDAMKAGIKWEWETFPEYLDVIDKLEKGINYAGYIGHSALRTYVMGERAFSEQATESDLLKMKKEVQKALLAGAIGFSTSRTYNHLTSDDRPVASRIADWSEVSYLVNAMGELDAGIFEIAGEAPGRRKEREREYFERLKKLAVESGRPITFGMPSIRIAPDLWTSYYDLGEEVAEAGGKLFVQAHSRHLSTLLSFKSHTPFDHWEVWRDIRSKGIEEQKILLSDPEVKRKLVDIASRPYEGPKIVGAEARPPEWDWVYLMEGIRQETVMTEVAEQRGVHPVEAMIDIALERDFDVFLGNLWPMRIRMQCSR